MKEINQKSIIALLVIYIMIVGGYGIFQLIKPSQQQTVNKEQFNEEMNTANAYITVGDHEKAAEHYQKAEKLAPQDIDVAIRLAAAQSNAGKYESAEITLNKIEKACVNRLDYWSLRTENMSNDLISIENINKAIKYSQKTDNLIINKENSWLYQITKAKIYLAEYKYYRIQRKYYESATQNEIDAKETFLATLKDLKEISLKRNDSDIMRIRDDLLLQYQAFPDFKYESEFDNLPELEKIPYTQEDIERIKQHRPQDDFPQK